ncbi:MAG TPA: alpha/beta hydrolase [Steroidobacteraceae bacterium]|nr:alpha/beta hydrolase [Steroidobacteraceae bacterium]
MTLPKVVSPGALVIGHNISMPNQYLRSALGAFLMMAGLSPVALPAVKDRAPQDIYVTANGIRLHCVTQGRGDLLKTGAMTEEDQKAYVQAWSQPGALTGGLNYYRASRLGPPAPPEIEAQIGLSDSEFGHETALAVIRVPTLVIWGEKDPALPLENLDGLQPYVPQLTIRRIPEGSHWVIHEKPAEVNGYIRAFITVGGDRRG